MSGENPGATLAEMGVTGGGGGGASNGYTTDWSGQYGLDANLGRSGDGVQGALFKSPEFENFGEFAQFGEQTNFGQSSELHMPSAPTPMMSGGSSGGGLGF